jgi:hypothetical protein
MTHRANAEPYRSYEFREERQKQLSDLFSSRSHLAKIPPEFRGIPFQRWRMLKIQEQCSQISRHFLAKFVNGVPDDLARTLGKAIATPRDSYGWRS